MILNFQLKKISKNDLLKVPTTSILLPQLKIRPLLLPEKMYIENTKKKAHANCKNQFTSHSTHNLKYEFVLVKIIFSSKEKELI